MGADATPATEAPAASKQQQDLDAYYGYPVDSERKAKSLNIFRLKQPHYMAFHLSWIAFFMSFLATFAPAVLITEIRDDLNLTKLEAGNAGVAAVCGAIFARVFAGGFVDVVGPRLAGAGIMLLFAPQVFLMSMVTNFSGFAAVRFFIGLSLSMFVICSYWVGSMFNVQIVGTMNAIAAGWGNMGGGATALIMPAFAEGLVNSEGIIMWEAWRWAFFLPGGIFLLMGFIILKFGQDTPEGDVRDLKAQGKLKKKGAVLPVLKVGLGNYRTWVLAFTYGYSFGVELTVDNMIVGYLQDQFNLSLSVAGPLGAIFGMMNLFSRASGGMLSDVCAKYWGMRGRLWCLWILQTLGGTFCIIMSYMSNSLGATIGVMVVFSIFCQQACGATFGVTPFVSRRAYGVVSGMVGAGGNVGSAITQAIWFAGSAQWQANLPAQEGLRWMGVQVLVSTLPLLLLWWPMWGSMLFPARPDTTEEDYYLKEWSAEEVAAGLHTPSMRFAMESRSMRGRSHRTPGATSSLTNSVAGIKSSVIGAGGSGAGVKPSAVDAAKGVDGDGRDSSSDISLPAPVAAAR